MVPFLIDRIRAGTKSVEAHGWGKGLFTLKKN